MDIFKYVGFKVFLPPTCIEAFLDDKLCDKGLVFCVSKTDFVSIIRGDLMSDTTVHYVYKCWSQSMIQFLQHYMPTQFSHG